MKINSIIVYNTHELLIKLSNGERRVFDIDEYLKGEAFKPLKDISKLKKFKVQFGCIE